MRALPAAVETKKQSLSGLNSEASTPSPTGSLVPLVPLTPTLHPQPAPVSSAVSPLDTGAAGIGEEKDRTAAHRKERSGAGGLGLIAWDRDIVVCRDLYAQNACFGKQVGLLHGVESDKVRLRWPTGSKRGLHRIRVWSFGQDVAWEAKMVMINITSASPDLEVPGVEVTSLAWVDRMDDAIEANGNAETVEKTEFPKQASKVDQGYLDPSHGWSNERFEIINAGLQLTWAKARSIQRIEIVTSSDPQLTKTLQLIFIGKEGSSQVFV